jgi:hypothetical protein
MENAAALLSPIQSCRKVCDVAISWQSDYRNLTTMERNGGVVNGLTFNAQLTVKLSVFSRLQSLINQSSGFCAITALPFDSPRRSQEGSACSHVAAACFHSSLMEFEHSEGTERM